MNPAEGGEPWHFAKLSKPATAEKFGPGVAERICFQSCLREMPSHAENEPCLTDTAKGGAPKEPNPGKSPG